MYFFYFRLYRPSVLGAANEDQAPEVQAPEIQAPEIQVEWDPSAREPSGMNAKCEREPSDIESQVDRRPIVIESQVESYYILYLSMEQYRGNYSSNTKYSPSFIKWKDFFRSNSNMNVWLVSKHISSNRAALLWQLYIILTSWLAIQENVLTRT